jgi:hypothetical protein
MRFKQIKKDNNRRYAISWSDFNGRTWAKEVNGIIHTLSIEHDGFINIMQPWHDRMITYNRRQYKVTLTVGENRYIERSTDGQKLLKKMRDLSKELE